MVVSSRSPAKSWSTTFSVCLLQLFCERKTEELSEGTVPAKLITGLVILHAEK